MRVVGGVWVCQSVSQLAKLVSLPSRQSATLYLWPSLLSQRPSRVSPRHRIRKLTMAAKTLTVMMTVTELSDPEGGSSRPGMGPALELMLGYASWSEEARPSRTAVRRKRNDELDEPTRLRALALGLHESSSVPEWFKLGPRTRCRLKNLNVGKPWAFGGWG